MLLELVKVLALLPELFFESGEPRQEGPSLATGSVAEVFRIDDTDVYGGL